MKYMLLIWGNEAKWNSLSPEEFAVLVKETDVHNTELFASGEMIGAYGVNQETEAKVVSVKDGVRIVTDGPYLEAKEYIGSFSIIDVDSYERALEVAASNPASRMGGIEVVPMMHEAGNEM